MHDNDELHFEFGLVKSGGGIFSRHCQIIQTKQYKYTCA